MKSVNNNNSDNLITISTSSHQSFNELPTFLYVICRWDKSILEYDDAYGFDSRAIEQACLKVTFNDKMKQRFVHPAQAFFPGMSLYSFRELLTSNLLSNNRDQWTCYEIPTACFKQKPIQILHNPFRSHHYLLSPLHMMLCDTFDLYLEDIKKHVRWIKLDHILSQEEQWFHPLPLSFSTLQNLSHVNMTYYLALNHALLHPVYDEYMYPHKTFEKSLTLSHHMRYLVHNQDYMNIIIQESSLFDREYIYQALFQYMLYVTNDLPQSASSISLLNYAMDNLILVPLLDLIHSSFLFPFARKCTLSDLQKALVENWTVPLSLSFESKEHNQDDEDQEEEEEQEQEDEQLDMSHIMKTIYFIEQGKTFPNLQEYMVNLHHVNLYGLTRERSRSI